MSYLLRLSAYLFFFVSLNSFGAYYVKTDGTQAPIESFDPNGYLGPNLMPGVVLPYVNLDQAFMDDADLQNSIITFDGNHIELHNSNFSNATVTILPSEHISLDGSNFFNAEIDPIVLTESSSVNMSKSTLPFTCDKILIWSFSESVE